MLTDNQLQTLAAAIRADQTLAAYAAQGAQGAIATAGTLTLTMLTNDSSNALLRA